MTTYYVSNSTANGKSVGHDTTGNGSDSLPWLTVSKALSVCTGGETVLINDGTYPEATESNRFALRKTNTSTVTVQPWFSGTVTITGTAGHGQNQDFHPCRGNVSNYLFVGITFSTVGTSTQATMGVESWGGDTITNVAFRECVFTNTRTGSSASYGVMLTRTAVSGLTFTRCRFNVYTSNANSTGLYIQGDLSYAFPAATAHAVMAGSAPNQTVDSVVVDDGGGTTTGYGARNFVTFSGGGGSGAAGTVTITSSKVSAIPITNHGSGYSSAPTVTVHRGGVLQVLGVVLDGCYFYVPDGLGAMVGVYVTGAKVRRCVFNCRAGLYLGLDTTKNGSSSDLSDHITESCVAEDCVVVGTQTGSGGHGYLLSTSSNNCIVQRCIARKGDYLFVIKGISNTVRNCLGTDLGGKSAFLFKESANCLAYNCTGVGGPANGMLENDTASFNNVAASAKNCSFVASGGKPTIYWTDAFDTTGPTLDNNVYDGILGVLLPSAGVGTRSVNGPSGTGAAFVPGSNGASHPAHGLALPALRVLGDHDVYGRPRLRSDSDCVGAVYPQGDEAENVLVGLVETPGDYS